MLKLIQQPWSNLRGISNSNAAKSTILVPLVGYWIIFNETLVGWARIATQLGGGMASGEVPRRLLWLYLALVLVGVASAIYSWRCPRIIKKYGDAEDYIKGDADATSPHRIDELVDELEARGYYELKDEVRGTPLPAKKIDVLQVYYAELDKREPLTRLLIVLLFSVDFFILTVLSAQILWRVLRLLIG